MDSVIASNKLYRASQRCGQIELQRLLRPHTILFVRPDEILSDCIARTQSFSGADASGSNIAHDAGRQGFEPLP